MVVLGVLAATTSSALAASEPKRQASTTIPAAAAPAAAQPTPQTAAPVTAAVAALLAATEQRKRDIADALAHCTAVLKTINAVTIPKETIDDGECGALAPIELISIGKNPEIALSPPAIVTCDLAVALHDWMKKDIQPLAKKHLGREVIRIETMSSYSCRNAYGRKMAKLSEHGKANALDIRGFVTTTGQTAHVLEDWGLTSGEIRVAAAKAEKEQAERTVATAKAQAETQAIAHAQAVKRTPAAVASQPDVNTNPLANAGTLIEGLSINGGALLKQPRATDYGLTGASKLGGPKRAATTPPPASAPVAAAVANDGANLTATSHFLRAAHASACVRFATTLGPEANHAHRNHFHVDLAARKTAKQICE
jgi:hypothetical protein